MDCAAPRIDRRRGAVCVSVLRVQRWDGGRSRIAPAQRLPMSSMNPPHSQALGLQLIGDSADVGGIDASLADSQPIGIEHRSIRTRGAGKNSYRAGNRLGCRHSATDR